MFLAILPRTIDGYAETATLVLLLAFLAAALGLAALWSAMLLPVSSASLRVTLVLGIAIGILDAVYRLWTFARQPGFHEWTLAADAGQPDPRRRPISDPPRARTIK